MLKFTDYLIEQKDEKTKSFWSLTKPFLKEGMDHGARMMEEKIQEMGYEFSGHKTLMTFDDRGFGFGIGVHFSSDDKKYFLVDNFSEGCFRLYKDDGRKNYTENVEGKGYSKPVLLSQSYFLEDVLKDVKNINVGKTLLDVNFDLENLETEEISERELKIDVTHITGINLKEYCDNLHLLLLQHTIDVEETYHTLVYFKDKPYRIIGGKRGYDVMNDKDMSLTDEKMRKI